MSSVVVEVFNFVQCVVFLLPGDAALGAAALFGGHGGLQCSRRSGDSSSKLSVSKLYS